MLDFFKSYLLLGIALRVVDSAILAHKRWPVLKRLDPL
jgi:hypothetical protein